MQIVRDLAGYTLGRSDLVRRAMAKKKHDVMAQEREYFIHGMARRGRVKVVVPGAVRQRRARAGGRAHLRRDDRLRQLRLQQSPRRGATAWSPCRPPGSSAIIPCPLWRLSLNSVIGQLGRRSPRYIQYCRGRNIPILPPSVNTSTWKFTVEQQQDGTLGIRFGLGAVKGVGLGAVEAIVSERQKGSYTGYFRFLPPHQHGGGEQARGGQSHSCGCVRLYRRETQPDDAGL